MALRSFGNSLGAESKTSRGQARPTARSTAARTPAPARRGVEAKPEKQVVLQLEAPHARSAAVAGAFNGWDARRAPMRRDGGAWETTLHLAPGRYEYRFVVDGRWISDPRARESVPNQFGENNSVLVVS